jgi:histidine triad (HIT) family protein
MSDCIFCKIVAKAIPSQFVFEDDEVVAFQDIRPKAPTHILVIPKKHIEKLADLRQADEALVGRLLLTVNRIADEQGLKENGYRVIVNNGRFAGQEVYHLHFHLLGGKAMSWNPA